MLVVGATGIYFLGYFAIHDIMGRPSTDKLPERFIMIAAFVDEPNAKNPGGLYMWVSEINDNLDGAIDPRAYRLPYTRPLHSQIEQALKRGRDGVSQMGTAKTVKIRRGKGKGGSWLQPGKDEQEILIRDLPNPQLPEK